MYIVDSYAWIEYFIGSQKGTIVKSIIEEGREVLITIECNIAELKGWCLRESVDFEELYTIVRANSEIHSIQTEDWLNAAQIRHEMRSTMRDFGMIDSILVAVQRKHNCKIITGDPHFQDIKDVLFI